MRPARHPDVVHELIDSRAVLVDAAGTELITLNRTGSLVWAELDGRRDVPSLADAILPELDGVSLDQLVADVDGFVRELADEGLVVDGGAA